jgi:hypothetical protein
LHARHVDADIGHALGQIVHLHLGLHLLRRRLCLQRRGHCAPVSLDVGLQRAQRLMDHLAVLVDPARRLFGGGRRVGHAVEEVEHAAGWRGRRGRRAGNAQHQRGAEKVIDEVHGHALSECSAHRHRTSVGWGSARCY